MRIALKYGLPVTVVFAIWIIVVRLLLGAGPESAATMMGPVVYNVAAICALFLGIIRRKNENGGQITFKEGVNTGLGIAAVYAVATCLFFFIEFLVAGPKLLMTDMGQTNRPLWQTAAMAYAGLFFMSLILGLIYSTLISFFLAKRRSAS
jgi:ABC-type phosphate/phosphonate transport system permease subunit